MIPYFWSVTSSRSRRSCFLISVSCMLENVAVIEPRNERREKIPLFTRAVTDKKSLLGTSKISIIGKDFLAVHQYVRCR